MANYTNHKNNKPLSAEVVKELRRRVNSGEAKNFVASSMGISYSVVRKYTDPVPQESYKQKRVEARELLERGMSKSTIAKKLGVSRNWVACNNPDYCKPRPDRIPSDLKDQLIRRVTDGKSVIGAARELGITADSAYRIAGRSGRAINEDEKRAIQKLKDEGASPFEIAMELQVPWLKVNQALEVNHRVIYSEEQKLEIAQLYSDGVGAKEIALVYGGVSDATIRNEYLKAVAEGKVLPRVSISMEDDRELVKLRRRFPQYEEWYVYIEQWYKIVKTCFDQATVAVHRFIKFLDQNQLPSRPVDFLLRANAKRIPKFFGNACETSDYGASMNNILVDFIDWVLVQPEFCDTSEDGDVVILPMYRNPIEAERRSDHRVKRGTESNKVVMPYWMIHDLRRRIAQGPNFSDWVWVQELSGKRTLTGEREGSSWYEVRENLIDKNDLDCVWRIRTRVNAGPVLEMWSPVRWVSTLLKLQTTARMGQIRMLDSGEADTFVFKDGAFCKSTSDLAKGTERRPRRQGVIRQGGDGSICLFLNTNKTADIGKEGAEKGMECAWPKLHDYQDDPYYWIEKIARWQSKYNPIKELTAWRDIPARRGLKGKSEAACQSYEDTAFLLRTPENKGDEHLPVSHGMCHYHWHQLVSSYERLLEKERKTNPDGSKIVLIADGKSVVTLHGLRVSLITHLILDGDVPPELMMKIVGHARFIMTIYYTKPGLSRIEDAISNAATKLDAIKDQNLARDLKNWEMEDLRNRVVFNAKEVSYVIPLNPADRNPMGWLPLHDGICLAGGNTGPVNGDTHVPGCHNGGPSTSSENRTYEPVPGGVRNCSRCRWKCAGKHHALGLQATLNNRQFHLHKESALAIEMERKRNELLRRKAQSETSNLPFLEARELINAERRYEAALHKMQELALDVVATYKMIHRIQALPDSSGDATALALQSDQATLHLLLEETDSELLILAGVCADVEFFPDLAAGTAIFEFAQLLDRAFEREGKLPILARMSEREKLLASNAIMRELEKAANPRNPYLARKKVVEIMDSEQSLAELLGVDLSEIVRAAQGSIESTSPQRLIEFQQRANRDEQSTSGNSA